MSTRPHVVVIGGGPAGATAAAILAKEGARVTMLERERFPRDHVGESLQPASITLLDRHLGLAPRIAALDFPRKYGAIYVWGDRREPWSVLFDQRLEADLSGLDERELYARDYEHAWNVDRRQFDHLLFTVAVEQGAEVLEEVEATAPIVRDSRVTGVRVRSASGESELEADFVIDASGQRCLFGRAMRTCEPVEDLRATGTYSYYDGAGGAPGPLGRHVQLVVSVDDGWVWFIPISADRTSVGVVTHRRERLDEARFDAILRESGLPLSGARSVPDARGQRLRFARDWSYTNSRFAGEGYLLAGDAACFVDPILSGGVDFAIRAACRAALALLIGLGGDADRLPELTLAYGRQLEKEYRAYLRLARYWYGNNRSVQGLFWEAHKEIPPESVTTPLRAFVYLTTGKLAADQHLKVFQDWQEAKMFRALGVDAPRLDAAWKQRTRAGGP